MVCYDMGMKIPPAIEQRRAVEDEAIRLGEERRELDNRLAVNTRTVVELLPKAAKAGVPLDQVAAMVGITRQTLYRWQGTARRLRPEVVFAGRGTTPTIRQAIALVMNDSPSERLWRPAEVIEAIGRRGWLPSAKSATQMIRNRMLSMLERGELVKRDPGGYYQLAPEIRNTGLLRVDHDD
jgi:hypothetical protein